MTETKEFEITCIVCPVGCTAKVTLRDGEVTVEGVECPRGREYAIREITQPVRDFFTTIRIEGGEVPVCPVRSTSPVPKEKILEYSRKMAEIKIDAPVEVGDVILEDLDGVDVNIIATRNIEKRDQSN